MQSEYVVVVDIIAEIVSNMLVPDELGGFLVFNYEPGSNAQIMKGLIELDNSQTLTATKYPLIAMVLPVPENRGLELYATVKIPKIIIGTLTNSTDTVFARYQAGGTFKKILYPSYYEFLRQIAKSNVIIGQDVDALFTQK